MKRSELESYLQRVDGTDAARQTCEVHAKLGAGSVLSDDGTVESDGALQGYEVEGGSIDLADYAADEWKAYVAFECVYALPNVAGPTMQGNYTTYHPEVVARSFGSLKHQQMNFHHQIKAYGGQGVRDDRIVGAVLGVGFPRAPGGGWQVGDAASAPAMRGVASVAKLARGVQQMVGESLTSKRQWSVSIEVISMVMDAAVFRPSTGEVYELVDEAAPDWVFDAISQGKDGGLKLGKHEDEQLVWAWGGINGTVDFRGIALTPTPAESRAKMMGINASREKCADAASAEFCGLVGGRVRFRGLKRTGTVLELQTSGVLTGGGRKLEAADDDPVVLVDTGKVKPWAARLSELAPVEG